MAGQPATDVDVRIGARICAARRKAGLTQRTLADAIGVSAAQLQKYEKGTNRISASALDVVATLVGTSITAFFDERAPIEGSQEPELAAAVAHADFLHGLDRYVAAKVRLATERPAAEAA